MSAVETPFPVEGTITPKKSGYSANLPCSSLYLTETEDGTDYLQAAVDRAAREYGEGVGVRVRFTSGVSGLGCAGFTLIEPVDGQEQDGDAETLCGDPDCSICSDPSRGTCADGFSNFVDELIGGDSA